MESLLAHLSWACAHHLAATQEIEDLFLSSYIFSYTVLNEIQCRLKGPSQARKVDPGPVFGKRPAIFHPERTPRCACQSPQASGLHCPPYLDGSFNNHLKNIYIYVYYLAYVYYIILY